MEQVYLNIWILLPLIIYIILHYWSKRNALPLPPGPKPLPLIGNLLDIPTVHDHVTYAKWGKEYGDVVHVSVFNKNIIILNSVSAANELLDQRSGIYSDRPYLPMMHHPKLWAFSLYMFQIDYKES